jgi:hypothetical protein
MSIADCWLSVVCGHDAEWGHFPKSTGLIVAIRIYSDIMEEPRTTDNKQRPKPFSLSDF